MLLEVKRLEVEAQQICLDAIEEVLKAVKEHFYVLRTHDCVNLEESSVKLEPYNRGYQLRFEIHYNWRTLNEKYPNYRNFFTLWIHPGSFFEHYMEKGSGASINFNFPQKGPDGFSTMSKVVNSMEEFHSAAQEWVREVKSQLGV